MLCLLFSCARVDPPTVTPAKPLPADPDVDLGTMDVECDGMVVALATFRACPNLEDDDKEDLDDWIASANRAFTAGKKAKPEPNAQKAIAAACHKATDSVKAATERCQAGKRPKADWEWD